MPRFRYQGVDAEGKPVSGELEAAGTDEALEELAARGLKVERAGLEQSPEPALERGRLSDEEAAALGSQLAQMAKAGLPLAPGLRALAGEMAGRRVADAVRRLAGRLESGMSLEAALESEGRRFPAHVRGLIVAGVQGGRLPEAMEEFIGLEGARIELRRQVWHSMAYPCLLTGAVLALFVLVCMLLVPQFERIFGELKVTVPLATKLLMWVAGPGLALVIGLPVFVIAAFMFLVWARGAAWARRVLYAVPFLGPVWRWSGLLSFSRMMALLLGQQIPLPRALRLTAAGLREGDLSAACRGAAQEVEAGRSLSACLPEFWQFPPTLRPLVAWAERSSDLAAAFRSGAEMFKDRLQVSITLLETILPPIVFLLIVAAVGFLVMGLMLPTISLIYRLS